MNRGKSNIYFNGVDDLLIKDVEELTGMKRGTVPFKYLGVNVSPKRLSVLECSSLVDRIVERIQRLGSRKLSYAGRVVLIQSVLSSLHTYWARIFILPKTVIARIEATCRSFLWHGNETRENPALVSWDAICQPKKQGGLGIKRFYEWNLAAIAKYAWWIVKSDHPWSWVHSVYIKSGSWCTYKPNNSNSWAWRMVCKVKDRFRGLLFESDWCMSGARYTIGLGYKWLLPDREPVRWYPWVNQRWSVPRHLFCCWLVVQGRLLTQDRLRRMHIIDQNCCVLCGVNEETHDHLFFGCVFSRKCKNLVSDWCKIKFPDQNSIDWWLKWRSRSFGRKKGMAVILSSLIYWIWAARNKCRVEGIVWRPEFIQQQIRIESCMRISMFRSNNDKFVMWYNSIK
ncbi:uncharacterized protein LOC141640190 [Silene latifolia]|uniref:uncharacterized protein LOC141640190 n=1 Tax=Silene latifolia TaxID=37657 RepID=UPI003D7737F6